MRVSKAKEGTLDEFDESNVLGEASVHVTVEDFVDPQIIPFNTSWGMKKADALKKETELFGHSLFSDEYWKMHPAIDAEQRSNAEVFYTGNFEFPISFLYFNNEQQLVATSFLVSSWERIRTPEVIPVFKFLKQHGYKSLGMNSETHNWEMYNSETKSLATCVMVFAQSQAYYSCLIEYKRQVPAGIDYQNGFLPNIDVETDGACVKLHAEQYVGQPISIYTADGKCVAKELAHKTGNSIKLQLKGLIIVKVGDALPIKVML